jgi:hypothetical protein
VIIVAVLFIILSAIGLVVALVAASIPGTRITFDDDQLVSIWDDAVMIGAIFNGISLVFAIAALIGARNYNIWLVGSNIIWLLANYIAGIILQMGATDDVNDFYDDDINNPDFGYNIPGFVINGCIMLLFMYPHVGFIMEVRSGIMSAETYPREEASCCCLAQRRV